jgi:hypothetical protein
MYWPVVAAAAALALLLVVGLTALAWVKVRWEAEQAGRLAAATIARGADSDAGQAVDPWPNGPTPPPLAAATTAAPAAAAAGAPKVPEPASSALLGAPSPGTTVGQARSTTAPKDEKVADPLLPPPEDSLKAERGGETYGTQVEFQSSPAKASKQAIQDHKLMFVLHISGNFEDAKFT